MAYTSMSQSLRAIRAGTGQRPQAMLPGPCSDTFLRYTAQVHLPRDGAADSELGPMDSQENALQICPQVNPMGAIPHLRVSLLRHVKLPWEANRNHVVLYRLSSEPECPVEAYCRAAMCREEERIRDLTILLHRLQRVRDHIRGPEAPTGS